jgi:hypothetical protein
LFVPDPFYLPIRIPDPGIKKAPDPGGRIRIRNTDQSTAPLKELVRIWNNNKIGAGLELKIFRINC